MSKRAARGWDASQADGASLRRGAVESLNDMLERAQ